MTADDLGRRVIASIGIPKDHWEIAAQLEVLGLRDSDARTSYGVRDLFELARTIYARFHAGAYAFTVEGDDPVPRRIPLLRFLHRYVAGIAFAMPMALQAASMLIWGYGIWGAIDLELWQGSAIALGFIASYIVAGGFAQAIVRRGLFYIYQQEEGIARWTALRGVSIALRVTLALIVPALLVNAIFRLLPWPMVFVAAAYYAGLAMLWLSWALIYLIRKTWLLLPITIAALAAVLVAAKVAGAPPLVANAIGILAADLLSFATAYVLLGRMAKKRGPVEPVNPPRLSVLIVSTSRYFLYGLLFNALLFADRIIAWTTPVGREDFPPYPFWLNVRYELAMDLALIVMVVMSGVVEYATERFSEKLIPQEKRTKYDDAASFTDAQLSAHRRRSFQLALSAIVALALAGFVVGALREVPDERLHEALVSDETMRVFATAAIGYVFFMFGVRDLLLLLTLSRVEAAVQSVAWALAADVVVGFVCSRAIGYWAAVFGLVAGAIVLMVMARRATKGVLAQLDYSYYAAY